MARSLSALSRLRALRGKRRRTAERSSGRRLSLEKLEERVVLDSTPFPVPLEALRPYGSLLYQGLATGNFAAASETDDFTIALDPLQTVTAIFDPQGARGAEVRLLDPLGNEVAASSSPGDGQLTVLQTAPANGAGVYTIEVLGSATSGAGDYTLALLLNAASEEESGVGANDILATAQSLLGSAVSLGGTADRLAVQGQLGSGDSDWFSFSLTAGQQVSLVASGEPSNVVALELYDAAGVLLTQGVAQGSDAQQRIEGYVADAGGGGDYFARIMGDAGQIYTLVVTRDAEFEREPNDIAAESQPLFGQRALGAIRGDGQSLNVDFTDAGGASLEGFTATGLWHATGAAIGANLPGHSSPDFAYYGLDASGNFNAGNTSGALTSPPLVIPAGGTASLSFNYRLQGEGGNPYDRADVQVSTNDGATWTTIASNNTSGPVRLQDNNLTWTPITLGLSAFAGNTVRVRFFFRTVDSVANSGLGWQVDDIVTNGADTVDHYAIAVSGGDALTITTATPGEGGGEPVNDLDPILELYAPNGTLVASNNNGAGGLNALINYSVPAEAGGIYQVRLARVTGLGDYTLAVTGATGQHLQPLFVTESSILDGAALAATPTSLRLTFSEPVLLTTLDPSDVTVGGVPVPLLNVVDGRTLEFDLAGAVTADGTYEVSLGPSLLASLRGETNAEFTSTFSLDTTPPQVTASSLSLGDSLNPGVIQISVEFSEDLNTSGLDAADAWLESPTLGTYFPSVFDYDPSTDTLILEFQGVQEGEFEFHLRSAADGLRDLVDNPLDGEFGGTFPSGDGSMGGDFVVPFTVDTDIRPWPGVFSALPPNAGLIHESSHSGLFNGLNDSDAFTLELDPDQSLGLVLLADDGAFEGTLTVVLPDATVYSVSSTVAGAPIVLNDVPVPLAGTYSVQATNTAGQGAFGLLISLNGSFEQEGFGGLDNGTPLSSQDLSAAFASLGPAVSRAGVVGQVVDSADEDYFALPLSAGETVSLALGTLGGGNADLSLLDAGGAPLALADSTLNLSLIDDFVATYSGTYYARVTGFGGEMYGLVVTRGAGFDHEPNDQPAPLSQTLSSSGAVLGRAGSVFGDDYFSLQVNSGDMLQTQLSLPAAGPGEFANLLDPRVRLLDENGIEVAADSTGSLAHTATSTGLYTVVVEAETGEFGDYLLEVFGATGGAAPFQVDFADPEDGAFLPFVADVLEVRFNDGVRLDTLDPTDILVDGTPVLTVEPIGANWLVVTLPPLAEGSHTISIAANSLLDWQGTGVEEFTSQFSIDLTPPRIVASTPDDGDIADSGTLVYSATFDEDLGDSYLVGTYSLLGPGNQSHTPTSIDYDSVTFTLSLTYQELPEGAYALSIGDVFDLAGNLLDGEYSGIFPSGDGSAGGDFSISFLLDQTSVAYPTPLAPLGIPGGLVFDPPAAGNFVGTGDVDEFTIDLDAGQTLTALLAPGNSTLAARLELVGPTGPIGQVDVGAGETAWLQTLPITVAGNYVVRATSLDGAGDYTLEVILNSVYEAETVTGVANDTWATAEFLESSSIDLGGGADRLSVIGEAAAEADLFTFPLAAGQPATLAVLALDGGQVELELVDANGDVLALGLQGLTNVTAAIRDFVAPVTGDYAARIVGSAGERYHLIVTRNAAFDLEPNNTESSTQAYPLLTNVALGYVGGAGGGGDLSEVQAAFVRSTVGRPWNSTSPESAMSLAFGAGNWDDLRFETVDVAALFDGEYAFVYLEGSDSLANELEAFLTANQAAIEDYVTAGNTLFVNSAPNEGNGMSFGFGGVTLVYPDSGGTATAVDSQHPVQLGPFTPTAPSYSGNSFSHASISGGNITPILVDNTGGNPVLAELPWGSGLVLFGGMTTPNFHSPQPAASNLRANILAYAASRAGDGADLYRWEATAGNLITLQTTTPGDGPGEFLNELDPELEVLDPAGNPIPHTNVSGNESLAFVAGLSGVYTVRVFGEGNTRGTYVLTASGQESQPAPLTVVETLPPDGSLLVTAPGEYRVRFSHGLLLSSVQADDLTVDGVPADWVTVIDGQTLEFGIAGANTGDGEYLVEIPAGAILSVSAAPLAAFTAIFDADATNPTVVASSLTAGDVVAPGPLTYTVGFSEELAQDGVGVEDVSLVESLTGTAYVPSSLAYDPATSTATVEFQHLPEGNYTLTVLTSSTAFRDRRGNLLDGAPSFPLPSGDGTPGDPFTVAFSVDVSAAPFGVLSPLAPLGGLIYEGAVAGALNAVGDLDVLQLPLDAGQRAALRFDPLDASLRGRLELVAPSGAIVGTLEAASAGESLVLPELAIDEDGIYQIAVSGLSGAGTYTVGVLLNGLLEATGNGSLATAQQLDASSYTIAAAADRLAVVGDTQAGSDDYFRFTLAAGQFASVNVSGLAGDPLTGLELYDEAGTRLAIGQPGLGAQNIDWRIQDIAAPPAGGDYALRLAGPDGTRYAVVVTRGASFDAEPNDSANQAQFAGYGLTALGAIQSTQVVLEPDSFPAGTVLNSAFPGVTLSVGGGGTVLSTTTGLASTGARVFSNNGNASWTSPGTMLQANFAFPVSEVSIDVIGDDSSDPGILQAFDAAGNLLQQFLTPVAGPSGVARVMTISRPQADIAFIRAAGYNGDTAQLDNLRVRGDFADVYQFEAVEGSVLDIRTATPLGDAGQPFNGLDPRLTVFDSAGFLVASDLDGAGDLRNARATFTVPPGGAGAYTVWVQSQGQTTGEYVLTIQGVAPSLGAPPTVVDALPVDGQSLPAPPTSLTLTFSESLRIDSIAAADLTIDGGASVTGFEVLDAVTVRFDLSVPDTEAVFTYSLADGALTDLQGLGSLAHSGSFAVDKTGPRILSQAPQLQSSAPFSSLTVVFDEPIDPASFTSADISSFTGPGGVSLVGAITGVSGSGTTYAVSFAGQTAVGTYTLVIGPNIQDLSGNAMNQNGNLVNGEAGDTYTATIDLQSPDLTVLSPVSVPAGGEFGQPITVTWTVQNVGGDPALEAWSDRVYLSTNTSLEEASDILLATIPAGTSSPLAAGATYARTVDIQLPLLTALGTGNYFVIVKTDALGQQPENSEANNTRVSEVLPIDLPPLPDLVVSAIDAPLDAFAGQQIPISWTLTNQGTGDATGSWTDQIFLSSDNQLGSDQFFGNFNFSGTIPAGQSVTRTQLINLPQNLQGNRWVIVRTDVSNTLYEHASEGNNTTVDDAPIDVRIPPLPNLQVSQVTAPATAFSSQSTVVEWVTTNAGTGATSAAAWYDAVYLSLDLTLDSTDVLLGEAVNSSYLNAGESYSNSLAVTLPRGIDGNYFFLVKTDRRNQVFEFESEGDNVGSGGSTLVQLTPPPDLRVTAVQAPPLTFSGQPISITWTVQNQGTGRTLERQWYDDIYMSADEELATSGPDADRYLGRRFHSGALEVDESYSVTTSVNLPVGISGEFYFFVRTDSFNQVYEHASEANNDGQSSPATNVLLTPPPDLEVVQVTSPATALAGRPYTVSFQVENFGATGTPNSSWTDSVYLSADTQLDSGDLRLGDVGHSGALPDGGSYGSSATFVLPNGLQGEFHVLVETDRHNVVFELDNANNVGRRSAPITVESRPADLTVSAASVPATGEAGKSVRVDYTVSNMGIGATAVTTWTDRVFASTDNTFSGDDLLLTSLPRNGSLDAGDTYTRSELVDIPFTFLGDYHLFVVTDATGQVFESNEGNNVSPGLPLAVVRDVPDLQVVQVMAPATALAGTDLTVNWTVRNAGGNRTNANFWYDDVWLSSDTVISGDDYRLGDVRRTNPLQAQEEYTASATFRLPEDRSGPLYLLVRADHTNLVFEDQFESNNDGASAVVAVEANPAATARPDLEVIEVDAPLEAFSGQPFTLSWTVRNNDVGTARSWYDAVYLSRDQIFDRDTDTYLGFRNQAGLAAGDSYTATRTFTLPSGLSGPFYVFVAADSGRAVDEAGRESNNVGRDSASMLVMLAPPSDLVVGTITVPASADLGRNATIQYTITNQGTDPARGSWYDSIYLSADDRWDVGDPLFGRVLHSGDVPGGGSYSETLTAPVPGVVPGDYHVIIRTDIRNNIVESDEGNNLSASLDLVDIDIEALELGAAKTGTLAQGQAAFYRVDVSSGETLVVTLDSASTSAANELYIRYGDVPSRTVFDRAFSDPLAPDQRLVVPFTRGGSYYVLAYGASVATAASYSIIAEVPTFSILDVGPSSASNRGTATLRINGSRFQQDGQVVLSGSGFERNATRTWWKDSTEMWATFDLVGLPVGSYDIRIDQSTESTVAAGALTVNSNAAGELDIHVSAPSALRPGQPGVVTVSYANGGQTDIPAPVLTLSVVNALLKLSDGTSTDRVEFLGTGPSGPAGILAPGARGSLSLVYNPTITDGNVEFQLSELPAEQLIDWDARRDEARPAGIPAEAWNIVWSNFTAQLGDTGAELRAVLNDNANHLSQIGVRSNDTARLLRFELQQASGSLYESVVLSPVSAGNAIDLAATADNRDFATQLPLFLARSFASGIEGRFRDGSLGRGWVHNWEISIEELPDGTVTVFQGAGSRVFTPDPQGGYRGLPGETGQLTRDGDRFRLEELAGIVLQFATTGLLESVADSYDNRITANYQSGRLIGLTHSDGESLALSYDALSRLAQVVDQDGRTVQYQYDGSGQHLVSVEREDGLTTYAYDTAAGSSEHALLSITHPDGAAVNFAYDSQGRQVAYSLNNGEEAISYDYDSAGGITLTDLDGNPTRLLLNDAGAAGRVTDATGNVTQLLYDDRGLLVQAVDPLGATSTFTYDAQGNLLTNLDALGQQVTFSYDSNLQLVKSVRDPLGRSLQYAYDPSGNLLAVTYPDGSAERFEPSATSAVAATVNRRDQETRFTYDERGFITRKDYADGTAATFTYNAAGNLVTATDSDSSVTFTYDQSDRLVRVTYDAGRYVQFAYDAIGRRVQMSDGAGYEVNYTYDASGRLDELTDAGGDRIVKYAYDQRGHLAREDNGNGTATTYAYDATGRLQSIVNLADDGSTVNSRFDYTYDAAGRRTSMTTLEGVTTYGYDAVGQLTTVTLPDGREIEYRYDAAGNRVSVSDDDVLTDYVVNNLNQYVEVDGLTQVYDADGNLVSRTLDGVTWTYQFDSENRLVRTESSEGDVWEFVYDALGNRVASTHNGQRTDFLVDPTGWGDVVAEYGPAGQLLNRYTYGIGLVGSVDGSGTAAYYDFDAIGNTVGLSGADGDYLNSYSYLPFGETLASVETVANDFEYGGQWGVSQSVGGLDYMRARYYDAATGRFVSVDPLRIQSNDLNFYRYAENNPVSASDPTGEIIFAPILIGAGVGAVLDIGVQLAFNGGDFGNLDWGSVAVSAGIGALGGAAGVAGAGRAGWEFSHWIPSRFSRPASQFYKGLPRWATENVFNGNHVPRWLHAATDPYRLLKGMKKWGDHLYPPLLRQLLRLPGWLTGGLLGPLAGALTRLIRPSDPNDILGPEGFGDERWVTSAETLPYTIRFENRASATAPAQLVTITQQLDPDLDPRTFRLGNFGWSGLLFEVPRNQAFFAGRLDVRPEMGIFVDVVAGINAATGEAFWILQAIDPATGEPPADATVGFLPPNDEDHAGEGFVTYTVRSRNSTPTGGVIDALATIVFDTEEPLDTPPIFNTVDAGFPSSQIEMLPPQIDSADNTFLVQWSGQDDEGGSALAGYNIFVSENGGDFALWLEDTQLTEATYVGMSGSAYAFFSRARDNAGNYEAAPGLPDASTIVASGDLTPPEVLDLLDVVPDPRNSVVDAIEFEVSEELDLASLDEADLTLSRNGVSVTVPAGLLLFERIEGTLRYRVQGLGALTLAEGDYVLSLSGAGVQDLAGNAGTGSPADAWTMDTTSPSSQVAGLPQTQQALVFPVSVTGSDPASQGVASGIASYDIHVSVDGGAWSLWANLPAGSPSADFTGESNRTYSFYSLGRDLAGNVESKIQTPEVTTYVPDLTAPVTEVAEVNASQSTFLVEMTGTDSGGSGLAYFHLFVQVDGGAVQQVGSYAAGTPTGGVYSRSASYTAIQDGQSHTYRFYSVGSDERQNEEPAPAIDMDVIVVAQFAAPPQLAISAFDVQQGGVQRSFVRHVDVTFSSSDPALAAMVASINDGDAGNDRIRLMRKNLDGSGGTAVSLASKVSAIDQVMAIDFGVQGIGGNRNSNVGDGYYELELDLDGDGSFESLRRFYRLLGDVNGSLAVDSADVSAVTAALGSSGQGRDEDVNGDGVVNAIDRTLTSRAVGRALSGGLSLDD